MIILEYYLDQDIPTYVIYFLGGTVLAVAALALILTIVGIAILTIAFFQSNNWDWYHNFIYYIVVVVTYAHRAIDFYNMVVAVSLFILGEVFDAIVRFYQ